MRHKFNFIGGVTKYPEKRLASKFLLFHLLPSFTTVGMTEMIFFQSLRNGYSIASKNDIHKHETNHPYFKIFTLMGGFGVQKQFFSFYFKLDIHETEIKILPLYDEDSVHSFSGKCRFLNDAEIVELLGEDSVSYNCYKQQISLPGMILKRMIVKAPKVISNVSSCTSQIRRIRV